MPNPSDIVFVGKTHSSPIAKTDRFLNFIKSIVVQYKENKGTDSMRKLVPIAVEMWTVVESNCLDTEYLLGNDGTPAVIRQVKFWERRRTASGYAYSPVPLNKAHGKIYNWLVGNGYKETREATMKAKATAGPPPNNCILLKMLFLALMVAEVAMAPLSRHCSNGVAVPKSTPSLPTKVMKDSEDPIVMSYKIYRNDEDRANDKPLVFVNEQWWWDHIEQYKEKERMKERKRLGKPLPNIARRDMQVEKYASGLPKEVSQRDIDDMMEPIETERSNNHGWISAQVLLFLLVKDFVEYLAAELEMIAPRDDWTQWTGNDVQTFLAAIATAGARDERLFMFIMALRKLDLFTVDVLATMEIRKLQNIFRYIGFNFWSTQAGYLIGAAKQIRDEYGGELPPADPAVLVKFWGSGRKIMMVQMVSYVLNHCCSLGNVSNHLISSMTPSERKGRGLCVTLMCFPLLWPWGGVTQGRQMLLQGRWKGGYRTSITLS
jgi:hypothetical protein